MSSQPVKTTDLYRWCQHPKVVFLFVFLGPQPYFPYFGTPCTYCPPVLGASACSHLTFPLVMLTHSFSRCKKRPARSGNYFSLCSCEFIKSSWEPAVHHNGVKVEPALFTTHNYVIQNRRFLSGSQEYKGFYLFFVILDGWFFWEKPH